MKGKKIGVVTLEHMMRVSELELGDKTYHFKNRPELPAGTYEVWLQDNNVNFVRVNHLLERSEHN